MNLKHLLLLLVGLVIINCKSELKKQTIITTQEIKFNKDGILFIINKTNDTLRHFDVEIADDSYERQTGLMYRKTMKNTESMLFIFKNEEERFFYMKNTYIPLDIIYINKQKKIVSIQKNAVPLSTTTLPSESKAKYVLEIKAGLSDSVGLMPGQTIAFEKL